jgi:hypothetical protein
MFNPLAAIDSVKSLVLGATSSPQKSEQKKEIFTNVDYNPVKTNWYSAKPYGFKFTPKNGTSSIVMFLPISPSNLTITTSFATNIIPTLYGTVEEHSPVRYYDINIEGTTGMGPRYVEPFEDGAQTAPSRLGRSTFSVKQTLGSTLLGGLFAKTLNRVENIVNDTTALFKPPEVNTGLYVDQTGYIAFHNLYRFLLQYKKDVSGVDPASKGVKRSQDAQHPLVFFNYKDCNQYKVVINKFTLKRDKEDPMMYHYSISMRGYDLTDVNNKTTIGDLDQQKMLKELGLDGVSGSTILGDVKKFATDAKGILGSVATGINLLGR